MRPVTFSMQFNGVVTPLLPGVLTARATAPSGGLVTRVERGLVEGVFEEVAGDEAQLEVRLTFVDDARFDEVGTISFGHGGALRFRSLDQGAYGDAAEPGMHHGAVVGQVDGAAGALEGATGWIVSNFLVADTGEFTAHELGIVWTP